jgi:hypothetical protein
VKRGRLPEIWVTSLFNKYRTWWWQRPGSQAIFCSSSTACGFLSYFTSDAAIFSR